MEILLNIISILISAILTFVFGVWMFRIQKKTNKRQDDVEQKKLDAERKKIEAEVWQMVNDELREQVDDFRKQVDGYKGERELLIQKYTQLETTFTAERDAWNNEKRFLNATIGNLKEQVDELTKQLKAVGKRTDQLEKKTGPLGP